MAETTLFPASLCQSLSPISFRSVSPTCFIAVFPTIITALLRSIICDLHDHTK